MGATPTILGASCARGARVPPLCPGARAHEAAHCSLLTARRVPAHLSSHSDLSLRSRFPRVFGSGLVPPRVRGLGVRVRAFGLGLLAGGCLLASGFGWAWAPAARAVILPPVTIDGPSSAIGEFGGAAVSEDGTGGLVYTKQVGGAQHVFAAQYLHGHWLAPVRVDWGNPYGATYPRIAAADGGWLVVVWVTQIATVDGRVQRALEASTLSPGGSSFGEQITVDPDVGEGEGVDPSLALAANGQGYVAYRAVTENFKEGPQTTIQPLHRGDVLADIRIARYEGQLWSGAEQVNRDPRLSMRPPTESNGPQVALGRDDQAVVAWQEPESNGVARIWARRVFGGTLGLALQASPTTYDGQPLNAEADAFALSVSRFGDAMVVSRVDGTPGTPLAGPRLFSNTLPESAYYTAGQFTGPVLLDGSATASGLGAPSVAVDDQGEYRIAFTSAGMASTLVGGEKQAAPELTLGPAAAPGAAAVTALNPEGGGVSAWTASGAQGPAGVGVREDFPGGGAQSALLTGAVGGPVSELSAGGSESGEALIGFREGSVGEYEIVGEGVSVPPPAFLVEAPRGWVRPSQAELQWSSAEDSTGGVTYSLVIDGHIVQRGIQGLSVLPSRRVLGSGVLHIQILAADASGQQTLSPESALDVDGSPPVASVRHGRGRTVIVRVKDAQSGALAADTTVSFGDGRHARGRLTYRHAYARSGRYVIVVHMRDRVGNEATAHLRVSVR